MYKWTGDSEYRYNFEQLTSFGNWIESHKLETSTVLPDLKVKFEDFNQKQKFFYKIVEKHYSSKIKDPLYLNCYERPGTGKSQVIHALQLLLGAAYVSTFTITFIQLL